jgi:hypothetical protein
MNWYVLFAKEDLAKLTAGDTLNLQEQICAIWVKLRYIDKRASHPTRPELPSFQQVQELQDAVIKHLSEIVVDGETKAGPFQISRFISQPLIRLNEDEPDRSPVLGVGDWESQILITGPKHDTFKDYLITHLFDLLAEHADSVKACPHCRQGFLQLRRHAVYCSRACQSVAAMQKQRAKAQETQQKPKRSKKSRNRTNHKGDR